ncbi:MAG: endonuclease III [Nanoarchaeota archaeon]
MNTAQALAQFKQIEKLKGNMRLAAEGWLTKFQTLLATILSARSLDETTIKVCIVLFQKYPDSKKLAAASQKEIERIIHSVNFYKNKSKHIIACAKQLQGKYNGEPPANYRQLIELPGVGNKTANVFLSEQGHNTIGVDTHVYYISRYLEWSASKKLEDVEKDLKKLFPEKEWRALNPTLVKFGKKYTSRREKNNILDKIKKIK